MALDDFERRSARTHETYSWGPICWAVFMDHVSNINRRHVSSWVGKRSPPVFNHKDTIHATSHRSSSEGWRAKSTSGKDELRSRPLDPQNLLVVRKRWVKGHRCFFPRRACDRQRGRLREMLHSALKFLKALWNSRGCCHDCSGVAFPCSRYIKLHCAQTDWFTTK